MKQGRFQDRANSIQGCPDCGALVYGDLGEWHDTGEKVVAPGGLSEVLDAGLRKMLSYKPPRVEEKEREKKLMEELNRPPKRIRRDWAEPTHVISHQQMGVTKETCQICHEREEYFAKLRTRYKRK